MAEYHRKIELQSPDDLQYLVSNVRRAANEKIDKDLPRIDGEDEMRSRVEEIIQAYINEVFLASSSNITINGMDPTPQLLDSILSSNPTSQNYKEIEEHEPFNTKLFERAKDLARQEEDLIEEIASMRRTVPAKIADSVKTTHKEGMKADDAVINIAEDRVMEKEKGGINLGIVKLDRQGDVEIGWERSVKGLEGLMGSLPEVVARKERAEKAEEYVMKSEGR